MKDEHAKYTLRDLKSAQFKSRDKFSSRRVDDIVYGDPYEPRKPMQKLVLKKTPAMALPRMQALPKSLSSAAGLLKKKKGDIYQYFEKLRQEWSL